jgi:NO-binding membrane sensor protein with MHYT domain
MEIDANRPAAADEPAFEASIVQQAKTRIIASIAALVGGAILVLLYLGFFAVRFPWYSNLAVVLSILIAVPALVLALWIHWGMSIGGRFSRRFDGPGW